MLKVTITLRRGRKEKCTRPIVYQYDIEKCTRPIVYQYDIQKCTRPIVYQYDIQKCTRPMAYQYDIEKCTRPIVYQYRIQGFGYTCTLRLAHNMYQTHCVTVPYFGFR